MPKGSEPDTVLSLKGVSKKFCRGLKRSLFYAGLDVYSDVIRGRRASDHLRTGEFWALGDVSFELKRGEALGLVGPNGSGKTTLLRLIAGLIKPDTGSIEVRGRLAPLIALGAGFNPILTGRENIVVNLSILGLSLSKIKAVSDAVIAFAEIEEAIDAPLRTYSSGMAARLGFACAMQVRPDILLVDEVLAVGDMRFRTKCYRKLTELQSQGTSIVLVSHNPNAILGVCDHALLLHKGAVVETGDTASVLNRYEEAMFDHRLGRSDGTLAREDHRSGANIDIVAVRLADGGGNPVTALQCGKPGRIMVELVAHEPMPKLFLGLLIKDLSRDGSTVLRFHSNDWQHAWPIEPGRNIVGITFDPLYLKGGIYSAKLYALENEKLGMLDAVESFVFRVESLPRASGSLYFQPIKWLE